MRFGMSVKQKPRLTKEWIDPFAISIVERLQKHGFESYLVGGCVRDLLAGIRPKDFDIVTMARPEEIKDVIDRAYIIGKRFRLVLVKRGADQFEVATFRKDPPPEESLNEDGLQVSDNVFGTPEEDARRRDFTVNSFFYDPIKDEILDYCDGMKDMEERVIRVIGDPFQRIKEDPIRTLRALRLAHKLDFTIEPKLRTAMKELAHLLTLSALPRRREEMLKILKLNDPCSTLHESHDLDILRHAFPSLDLLYTNNTKTENDDDAVDVFDSYISRIHDFKNYRIPEPTYLFGVLLLAYCRARLHQDPHKPIQISEQKENEFLDFMKKELGVFNLEASLILKALSIQHELLEVEDYKRRGRRRQKGFLRNEAFDLALTFASIDHVLSPSQLEFWRKEFLQAEKEFLQERPARAPRSRRPRNRT